MREALDSALYGKLTGGTALTALLAGTTSVFNKVAPPAEDLDFVVFDVSYDDLNTTVRRAIDARAIIRGVSETSHQKAGSIDMQVDALIHDGTLTVTGWNVYWQKRVRGLQYSEITPAHRAIWHVGGEYLIRLEEE